MVSKQSIYNELAQNLNDASIDRQMAIGMNYEIISWNKMAELCTGIDRENILGKNLFEVFPQLQKDEEMIRAWKNALTGYKTFLPSKPGFFNRTNFENHFIPLKDQHGKPIGAMNIMHDVTQRIKAEKQLADLNSALKHKYEQLERVNNELATFTSITGSELKQPIKHLYTSLEMIVNKEGQRLSDSSRAGLRRMQASLNRINLLLGDILALSSAGSLSHVFSQVDLNTILKNVIALLQAKIINKQAIIKYTTLPVIYGSAEMLQNLFYNILDNSLKFQLPDNIPHISISSYVPPAPKDDRQLVCILFSDNGVGIAVEDKAVIFEMFGRLNQRKEYPGSGIGLTISQKIAEAHEGYIEAESEVGKGTTIKCFLSTTLQQKGTKLS